MRIFGFLMLFCLLFSVQQSSQAQQVWTKKKGELYTHLGSSFGGYSSVFSEGTTGLALPRFVTDLTIDNYTEYGILDNFVATLQVPLRVISTSSQLNEDAILPIVAGGDSMPLPAGTLTALGNIRLGLTYGIMQDKAFRMAFKLNTMFNTATYNEELGLRSGPSTWGFCPLIIAGYGHKYFFTSSELGFNFRTNGYSNQLISNTQIGTTIKENYYIILTINLLTPIKPTNYDKESEERLRLYQTGVFHNNQQYLSPGLKFGCNLNSNWSLWAGVGVGGGVANEVGQALGVNLAVSYQIKK